MKQIIINDRILHYETIKPAYDGFSSTYTKFYEGFSTYNKRKYWFFGPKIKVTVPKHIFTIYDDSENPRLSKEWWNMRINDALKIADRKEELNKGQLI